MSLQSFTNVIQSDSVMLPNSAAVMFSSKGFVMLE